MQPWHTLVVWAGSVGDRLHLRATIPHSVGLRAGALASPRLPHSHGMPLEQVCNRLRAQRWARVSPLRNKCIPQLHIRPQAIWRPIRFQEIGLILPGGLMREMPPFSLLLEQEWGPRQPEMAGVRGQQLLSVNFLEVSICVPHLCAPDGHHHCSLGLM